MKYIILLLAIALSSLHAADLPKSITADGTYTHPTYIGKRYVVSVSGTFGGGSLAINWTNGGSSTAYTGSPATAAKTFTFTAASNTAEFILTGSTTPALAVALALADSGASGGTVDVGDITGLGTAATADASTTGGVSKILQTDANGNLYLAPLIPNATAAAESGGYSGEDGNLLMRNLKFIGWYSADATGGEAGYTTGAGNMYAQIRFDKNHPTSGEWNFDSAARVCWYWRGGWQYGNPGGSDIWFTRSGGDATSLAPIQQSVPDIFTTQTWNGSASVERKMGLQVGPLDTTGTNTAFRFFDAVNEGANGRNLQGTEIAQITPTGIWSNGTAPTFSALTTGGATITQTCSKYKTVQTAKFTLDGNRTLVISGALNGMRGVIYVSQPSSGAARTLALPNGGYLPSGWTAPYADLSTINGYTDRLEWEYDNSSFIWTVTKGLVATYTATDTDAAAYITAVETAKGSVATAGQKAAIDAFVIAEKAASRWTLHKRLFLPIWANAGANSIDMKTLATGTFLNSPTHGAGWVQGNGTTAVFDVGSSPSTLGMTMSSAASTVLLYTNSTNNSQTWGVVQGSNNFLNYAGSTTYEFKVGATQLNSTLANTERKGIFTGVRNGTAMAMYRRTTSGGFATIGSSTVADSGAIPTTNLYFLGANGNGTAYSWNAQAGFFGVHSAFDSSNADAFTGNVKTLWETCTGLTLP